MGIYASTANPARKQGMAEAGIITGLYIRSLLGSGKNRPLLRCFINAVVIGGIAAAAEQKGVGVIPVF